MLEIKNLSLLVVGLCVAGCQTTGGGMDTSEARLAKNIMATHCVVSRSDGSLARGRSTDDLYVHSITNRQAGWKAADMSTTGIGGRGLRGNIYFNTQTGEIACGTDNWRRGMDPTRNYTLPKTNLITSRKTTDGKPSAESQSMKRSIAVSWEGYANLFSGVIEETRSGKGGDVKILLPSNEGVCNGRYDYTAKGQGSWSVACTNNLAASGTFSAFGNGKGASGEGVDALGRKVKYTMGGAL